MPVHPPSAARQRLPSRRNPVAAVVACCVLGGCGAFAPARLPPATPAVAAAWNAPLPAPGDDAQAAAAAAAAAAPVLAPASSSAPGTAPAPAPALPSASPSPSASASASPSPSASASASASADGLRRWWALFDDPLLLALIDAAQAASPDISSAASRIAQARAVRVAAQPGGQYALSASALRGRTDPTLPAVTSLSAGLQASWEIDLFGAVQANRDAAESRLNAARSGWHEARIAVAAEVASSVIELRACEGQLALSALDVASRTETARLTDLVAGAGFRAPADAALARASAAQGRSQQTVQRTQCGLLVKSLVALTALEEADLRGRLAAGNARLPQGTPIVLDTLPAALLQQRPDLATLGYNVAAAAADTAQRTARQWPQVALSGSLGSARASYGGATFSGTTWAIGPLTVTLPVFDGGQRAADVQAARAAYDDAVQQYQARVRTAVREVEEALLRLDGTASRNGDAAVAAEGFEAGLRATDARYRGGLATPFELEDARRSAVLARSTLIDLQRERLAAWVALYRALGGGWSVDALAAGDPVAGTGVQAASAQTGPLR